MKRTRAKLKSSVVAALVLGLIPASVSAQNYGNNNWRSNGQQRQDSNNGSSWSARNQNQVRRDSSNQTGSQQNDRLQKRKDELERAVRASSLEGMDVRNYNRDKVGEVQDLIVDLHRGTVPYVVVSIGGFLGIGQTLTAVPSRMFNLAGSKRSLWLDTDKDVLAHAPKFHSQQWPILSQAPWAEDIDRYYGYNPAERFQGRSQELFLSSDLEGKEVEARSGEKVGDVRDLMVDVQSAKVLYVIVQDLPDSAPSDMATVPPTVFMAGPDRDNLRVPMTKQQFAQAPTFSRDQWQSMTEPNWNIAIYRFFNVNPETGERTGQSQQMAQNNQPYGRQQTREYQPGQRNFQQYGGRRDQMNRGRQSFNQSQQQQDNQASNPSRYQRETPRSESVSDSIAASRLKDLTVRSDQGKDLGNVQDLIVNIQSGDVPLAVLSVGNESVAVPTDQLHLSRSGQIVWLDASQKELKNASKVDHDQMQASWADDIDRCFGGKPDLTKTQKSQLAKASDLIGKEVTSKQQGETVGKVKDLQVSLDDGQILFVTVKTDDGQEETVPPAVFTTGPEKDQLYVSKSKEELAQAPRRDQNRQSDVPDYDWAMIIYRYYGVPTSEEGRQNVRGRQEKDTNSKAKQDSSYQKNNSSAGSSNSSTSNNSDQEEEQDQQRENR